MKLFYFDLYGRAEGIRMLLHKAGVQFEDVRITREQHAAMKEEGKLEYGQVPMLELDDGTRLVQGNAIIRYIARQYNMLPASNLEAYQANKILDYQEDWVTTKIIAMFGHPDKEAATKKLFEQDVPEILKWYEKTVAGKKYAVGGKYTFVDTLMLGFLHDLVLNPKSPMAAMWQQAWEAHAGPGTKEYLENMREEHKDYLANRKTCTF